MTPEFSRIVPLARIPEAGREERLEAQPAECAALARRFAIPAVNRLRAVLRLRPEPGGAVLAEGRMEAEVVQDCVVTLEHDGDDWSIAAVAYRSEFGGPSHDFDVARLASRPPDGTLADLVEREILRLIEAQYNTLADAATREARAG